MAAGSLCGEAVAIVGMLGVRCSAAVGRVGGMSDHAVWADCGRCGGCALCLLGCHTVGRHTVCCRTIGCCRHRCRGHVGHDKRFGLWFGDEPFVFREGRQRLGHCRRIVCLSGGHQNGREAPKHDARQACQRQNVAQAAVSRLDVAIGRRHVGGSVGCVRFSLLHHRQGRKAGSRRRSRRRETRAR